MSSNISAGPLFVDYSSNYLFFMDLAEAYPFIGKVTLDLADPGTTSTYVSRVHVSCCLILLLIYCCFGGHSLG